MNSTWHAFPLPSFQLDLHQTYPHLTLHHQQQHSQPRNPTPPLLFLFHVSQVVRRLQCCDLSICFSWISGMARVLDFVYLGKKRIKLVKTIPHTLSFSLPLPPTLTFPAQGKITSHWWTPFFFVVVFHHQLLVIIIADKHRWFQWD